MADRISISPEEIGYHAANLQTANDAIKALVESIHSRMAGFKPGSGGPDSDAIEEEYYKFTGEVHAATITATEVVRALTDTMNGVGNALGQEEELRALQIQKLTLDDYPANYDVKNSGPAGPPVIGTTGPVIG